MGGLGELHAVRAKGSGKLTVAARIYVRIELARQSDRGVLGEPLSRWIMVLILALP